MCCYGYIWFGYAKQYFHIYAFFVFTLAKFSLSLLPVTVSHYTRLISHVPLKKFRRLLWLHQTLFASMPLPGAWATTVCLCSNGVKQLAEMINLPSTQLAFNFLSFTPMPLKSVWIFSCFLWCHSVCAAVDTRINNSFLLTLWDAVWEYPIIFLV